MKPDQIIDQFKATIDLLFRKKFLRDEERYHQIIGAYNMAQSMIRNQPAVFHEELPEHLPVRIWASWSNSSVTSAFRSISLRKPAGKALSKALAKRTLNWVDSFITADRARRCILYWAIAYVQAISCWRWEIRAMENTTTPPTDTPSETPPTAPQPPKQVLVIDIGGTKLKVLATGQTEPRKVASGKRMTPARMIEAVKALTEDWEYQAVSIGFPGLVGDHGPRSEPGNLGSGWVGFDYAAAFGMPVRISNDAAMQAMGSYEGGRMLFLGLGTGLGSALIAQNAIVTLELGRLLFSEGTTLGELLGRRGFQRMGKKA
jgi:hypothetical protein